MSDLKEVIELEIVPIPPETVASTKEHVIPLVEEALREAGRQELLTDGEIQIQVEQTFPVDAVIVLGLTFLSQIALETYKEVILPRLKQRYMVKSKSKRGKQTGKKKT